MKLFKANAVFLAAFFCLSTLLLVGCGSGKLPTFPVSGQLKFEDDGSFPKFGEIEFYNAEHKINARGKIERDGSFTVKTGEQEGAIKGLHQIVITQQVNSPHFAKPKMREGDPDKEHVVKHDHGLLVDTAYLDYRTSGLECTITEGENRVELLVRKRVEQTEEGMPIE